MENDLKMGYPNQGMNRHDNGECGENEKEGNRGRRRRQMNIREEGREMEGERE